MIDGIESPQGRSAVLDYLEYPAQSETPQSVPLTDRIVLSCTGTAYRHGDLFDEMAPLVRRLIRRYGQDAEMRQDLEGEIYCRYCTLLDLYDPDRGIPLRPYLVRQLTASVYTYARHHWRTRKKEVVWELDDSLGETATTFDPTLNWISAIDLRETAEGLPKAIAKLPLRQQKVVVWRYYEERSFEQIAASLQIQPATARSLLRHGLNNLRNSMAAARAEMITASAEIA